MRSILIILSTILSLTSCTSNDEQKTITIGNRYSLKVPSIMTEVTGLNDDASLQYKQLMDEFYVIVLDEPKEGLQIALEENDLTEVYEDNLKGYSDLILDGFEETITVSRKSEIIDTLVNNMPARILTMNGGIEGVSAYYSVAFIKGNNSYYQVMTWTLSHQENQYKEKMDGILYSLKELTVKNKTRNNSKNKVSKGASK